jgi:adenylate kinase family enzyme
VSREKTAPLIGYYRQRGLLREIDGHRPIAEVTSRMLTALGEAR